MLPAKLHYDSMHGTPRHCTARHGKVSFGEINSLLLLIKCAGRAWGLTLPSLHGYRNRT